jgi:hypothetical protein
MLIISASLNNDVIEEFIYPAISENTKFKNIKISGDISDIILYKTRIKKRADSSDIYDLDNTEEMTASGEALALKEKTRKENLLELQALALWFSKYDLQVSQYQRSLRQNDTSFVIEIDGTTYQTITDLDAEATKEAD